MKKKVMLSLRGQQDYGESEPEVISLITDGILEKMPDGWCISYAESDLTGMEGVFTSFYVRSSGITLTRSGKLSSQMVFEPGKPHASLYEMPFGALMITVSATRIRTDVGEYGGTVDLEYKIDIEQTAMGVVTYHLDIAPIEE